MIEITAEIRALIDKAAAGVELAEDEYIDLSDGLIHCKKCGGLALFLGLPLTLADTAGHEVAGFPKAWHNGLPLAAAFLTVNEPV